MPLLSDLDYSNPVKLPINLETIAIIGGGASGAIILDTLLKEPSNIKRIVVYERQDKLGGIWLYNKDTISTPNDIIKSGNLNFDNDPQLDNPFKSSYSNYLILPKNTQERFIETPSYFDIKTNIVERLMTYSDVNKWNVSGSSEDGKYVPGNIVQEYIEKYIVRNINESRFELKLGTAVEDVERYDKDQGGYGFKLTIRTPYNKDQDYWYQDRFDYVIVATGHYHVPYIPYVPGLRELQELKPNIVQHAKFFRTSTPYRNKTVVVVGSRASGADLTKFVAKEENTRVYQSIRNSVNMKKSNFENVEKKPVIREITTDDDEVKVVFEDGSIVYNPDYIIYCTGYLFSYPFLNRLFNNSLTYQGQTVANLYQHTFLINEPLISIIGVPIDAISFRAFEYQAILIARFITGKIALPSRRIQSEWVNDRYKLKKNSRAYHTIGVDDALEYMTTLTELGQVSSKTPIGRQFPEITPEMVQLHRESGEILRKFWDEY
ncbi:unnamed protein product [Candida verbasci]|uniref:Thiol-specific monooxygenase n=1 Tax=Candida verbasci TaxID=1227364 RepID=A0A9W4TW35_9ASCO|nr:unnamed protein product [Candida verbasci]